MSLFALSPPRIKLPWLHVYFSSQLIRGIETCLKAFPLRLLKHRQSSRVGERHVNYTSLNHRRSSTVLAANGSNYLRSPENNVTKKRKKRRLIKRFSRVWRCSKLAAISSALSDAWEANYNQRVSSGQLRSG